MWLIHCSLHLVFCRQYLYEKFVVLFFWTLISAYHVTFCKALMWPEVWYYCTLQAPLLNLAKRCSTRSFSIRDTLCIDYLVTGFLVLLSAFHYKVRLKGYGEPFYVDLPRIVWSLLCLASWMSVFTLAAFLVEFPCLSQNC